MNSAPTTSAWTRVSGSWMLRFWLPTWTTITDVSTRKSSTSAFSTNGIFITRWSTPSTVQNSIGLSEEYSFDGSSSPKIMSAIRSSFSRPLSSVRIILQVFVSRGSNTEWISSMYPSCYFSFSAKNPPPAAASAGMTLFTTIASTFLLYRQR